MNKKLLQSWRWYGPNDSVTLKDIKQAGATAIVTALHHVPHGEVWTIADIDKRKAEIEAAGLTWEVVESVPVHESIKTQTGNYLEKLTNYNQSLKNLASCGIKTVCYNFMPVLDWTRTQLDLTLKNGAKALNFNWIDLAIFDLFILKREGANLDYSEEILQKSEIKFKQMCPLELQELQNVILMGIPGENNIELNDLLKSISVYKTIGHLGLQKNLVHFLKAISETCIQNNIKMTIHPDDPPYPILGLPRIASTLDDFNYIFSEVTHEFNGMCFCTGSLGAGNHSNIPKIFELVKERIHFVHLRNVLKDSLGNFHESNHLEGDVNMYQVMKLLVQENQKRDTPIPFRPDHGHQILDDLNKSTNPGYSAIGRLKGLAELRGLELGILGQ